MWHRLWFAAEGPGVPHPYGYGLFWVILAGFVFCHVAGRQAVVGTAQPAPARPGPQRRLCPDPDVLHGDGARLPKAVYLLPVLEADG